MVNITKKVLEEEVKRINKAAKIKLDIAYENKEYSVYVNKELIFTGNAKESYILLQGLACGLRVKYDTSLIDAEPKDEFKPLDYIKGKEGQTILIEAKKTAKDPYFSQCKNKYVVNIVKVTSNQLYFTAKADVITPSGYKSGNSLNISMQTVKVSKEDTMDKIGETILKAIDMSVIEQVKKDKNLHSDRILWLTKDHMWYLGWSNVSMLTQKVEFQVV